MASCPEFGVPVLRTFALYFSEYLRNVHAISQVRSSTIRVPRDMHELIAPLCFDSEAHQRDHLELNSNKLNEYN